VGRTLPRALGDDGFGCELAGLEFGTLCLFFVLRLLLLNRDVSAARQNGTPILRSAVGRADLNELRLGRDRESDMSLYLRLIVAWVANVKADPGKGLERRPHWLNGKLPK
jgi:hypothetical protein